MFRAIRYALLIGAALAAASNVAIAATVTLDGQSVTPVVQRNGQLLIPFRTPMERLGAQVNWSNPTAAANLNGQQLVTVNMGSSNALIRGTTHTLSVAPVLIGGSAFVPIDALADICGAHVAYSANRTSANVTGCNLAGINSIAARAPAPGPVTTPAVPTAQGSGIPWWAWLLIGLAVLGALWAWARARTTKTVYTTNPYSEEVRTPGTSANVVRGTIDDYVPRLKSALTQMDNSHRASFVQQLSQTFKENRATIPESLVASTRGNFDTAASGAPGPVSALVDSVGDHPSILQMAAQRFATTYPGELGALANVVKTRM